MRGRDDTPWSAGASGDDGQTHSGETGGPRTGGDLQAEAAHAEGVLDEVRVACQRVRDAWRELWR
jgi:hypothetical protein